MTFWQRTIAIAVLMVFTPASVLAGTPLRLCVGDDGHRAIEFVLSAQHHNDTQGVDVADCAVVGEHFITAPSECTDSPLLSVAQKPSTQAKTAFALDDATILALLPPVPKVPTHSELPRADVEPAAVLLSNAQLDALRTVVLLI